MDTSKKALREIVFNQIVDDIIHGRINAGEKLLEITLAKKFNVSRTPVREALLQLEKEGYTSHTKDTGTIVRKISVQKVQEIYEILSILEANAVEQVSAGIISKKDLSFLDGLNNEMDRLANGKKYAEYMQKNAEFHNYFLKKQGNKTLMEIDSDLRRKIYRRVSEGLSLPIQIDNYIDSHKKIVEALKLKNGEKAKKLMLLHLKEAACGLTKEIEKPSRWVLGL